MILYARIARWESFTCRWYVSIRDKIREARFNILLIVWLRTSEQIQPQFLVQPRERMSSRQQRVFQTRKLPLLLVAAGLGSWNSLRVLRVWSSAHPKTIVTTVFCQCCNSIAILCGPATWLQSVYMHIISYYDRSHFPPQSLPETFSSWCTVWLVNDYTKTYQSHNLPFRIGTWANQLGTRKVA